jgi:hypothetical protein
MEIVSCVSLYEVSKSAERAVNDLPSLIEDVPAASVASLNDCLKVVAAVREHISAGYVPARYNRPALEVREHD